MILLFKRKQTYEIALELKSKPAELAFFMKLTKLQYKVRLIAAQADSSSGSMTVTPQSGESIVIRVSAVRASASSSPVILKLS